MMAQWFLLMTLGGTNDSPGLLTCAYNADEGIAEEHSPATKDVKIETLHPAVESRDVTVATERDFQTHLDVCGLLSPPFLAGMCST